MKKAIIIALLILVGASYFWFDRNLFYYGESRFSFYRLLPFKIKPENRPEFEKGFVLWDAYEMSLIGNGVRYFDYDSITVDKIISYKFNDTILIAKIIDTKGYEYSFEFTENENKKNGLYLSVKLNSDVDLSTSGNLKNIEITKDISKMVLIRNLSMILFISLMISSIFIFRKKGSN